MDFSLPGSSIYGIFQVRVLEWGSIAFSETASYLKIKTTFVLINFDFEAFNPEPRTHYFLVHFLYDIKYLVDAYDMSSNTESIQLKYYSALNH